MLVTHHKPKQVVYIWSKQSSNESVHYFQRNRVALSLLKHFALTSTIGQEQSPRWSNLF